MNRTVAGSGEQIKVTYFTRSGSISKAYIDPETGEGIDKHSDIPITLAHQESDDSWYQIDHREWRVNHLGEFEEVVSPASENVMAPRRPRTQPKKKQSRAERRRKPSTGFKTINDWGAVTCPICGEFAATLDMSAQQLIGDVVFVHRGCLAELSNRIQVLNAEFTGWDTPRP
jgi:hypothetical protein